MTITKGEQLLAELQGETARAWQEFADVNHVSVAALLNALGPILRQAEQRKLGFREALNEAVAAAR